MYSDSTGVGTEILALTADDLSLCDLSSACSLYHTEENTQGNPNWLTDNGLEQRDLHAANFRAAIRISL